MANELSSNPEEWPREKIPPALKDWIVRNINVEEDLAAIAPLSIRRTHSPTDSRSPFASFLTSLSSSSLSNTCRRLLIT